MTTFDDSGDDMAHNDDSERLFPDAVVELERRVLDGEADVCESVLAAYPGLAEDREAVLELVYTEYVLRQEQGEEPTAESWLIRFPALRRDLMQLFQVHDFVNDSVNQQATTSRSSSDTWSDAAEENLDDFQTVGNYILLEQIGCGGMGVVYRARQRGLRRIVALKMISGIARDTADGHRRFRAETEAVARLQHPNIIQIFEVGTHQNVPYFSMEYVSGGNLADLIRESPLPSRSAAKLIECVARAVDYAHGHGIVHRDLKPANILIEPKSHGSGIQVPGSGKAVADLSHVASQTIEPKIADFGLAKHVDSHFDLTVTGATLGTPNYMAPEQTRDDPAAIGPACDIYALGAVLYELIVGRPPFFAATALDTLHQVRNVDPLPPTKLQPDIPRDLETICLKCINKDPARRYATAGELADDLRRFLAGEVIQARPAGRGERAMKWIRRHPVAASLIVAIALGLIGTSWQWFRAETNRQAAERQAEEAQSARNRAQRERRQTERLLYAHDIALAHQEYLGNNVTRARQLLNDCPSGMRNWEWHFLERLCNERVREVSAGSMPIYALAVRPEGDLVAAGTAYFGTNQPGEVHVWNTRTGQLKYKLNGFRASVMGVEFSHDGKRMGTSEMTWHGEQHGDFTIWDADSGGKLLAIPNVNSFCHTFDPLGRWIAVGQGREIALRDVQTGEIVRMFANNRSSVYDLSFRSDGQLLAVGTYDGTVTVFETATGQLLATGTGFGDVRSVMFSPSGGEIAIGTFSGQVKILKLLTNELNEVASYRHSSPIADIQYSPDGLQLFIAAADQSVECVNVSTGKIDTLLRAHNGSPSRISFSADGRLVATAGYDGTVCIWNQTIKEQPVRSTSPDYSFLSEMAFHPDGKHVAFAFAFNYGRSNRAKPSARFWNHESGTFAKEFTGNIDWLTSVVFHSDGKRMFTGGKDQTIHEWDTETGEIQRRLTGHARPLVGISSAGNGEQLVSLAEDGELRLWDIDSGSTIHTWRVGNTSHCLSVSCTGLIATGGADGILRIWERDSTKPKASFPSNLGAFREVAFQPDGGRIAMATDTKVIALVATDDLMNGKPISPMLLIGHTGPVRSISFTPDGKRLASVGVDRSVKLWDLDSGQELLSLRDSNRGHEPKVRFSPDGKRLVSINQVTLEIWNRDGAAAESAEKDIRDWHVGKRDLAERNENWHAMKFHGQYLIDLEPDVWTHRTKRGMALAGLGDWAGALQELDSVAEHDMSTRSMNSRALLYLQLGRVNDYQQICQQLVGLNTPSLDPGSINTIVWTCSLAPDPHVDLARVRQMAVELVAQSKSAMYVNTLGTALYRCGELDEAIANFEESIRQQTPVAAPFDWCLLALVYAQQGRHEESAALANKTRQWLLEQRDRDSRGEPTDRTYNWQAQIELPLLLGEWDAQRASDF